MTLSIAEQPKTTSKPAKTSKPRSQSKGKQQPAPQFLAHGVVQARLSRNKETNQPCLRTDVGDRLSLVGIDSSLALWLLGNLEQAAKPSLWLVYPQRDSKFFLKSFNPSLEKIGLEVDQFRICGTRSDQGNSLFIGRNQHHWRGAFEFIDIVGLPGGKPREVIKVLAKRSGNSLEFVDFDSIPE